MILVQNHLLQLSGNSKRFYLLELKEIQMKQILTLLIALIGFSFLGFTQPNNEVETIDGKKYYVHLVEQGNTLYGIHTHYNVSVESILEANKGLSDNLTVGQKILIPIEVSNKEHYQKHKINQGETLYGISKKYGCSVADLKKLNNNLSDGISPGQEIYVPRTGTGNTEFGEVIQTDPVIQETEEIKEEYNVSLKDSVVKHVVLPHETMYSIAKRYMVSQDTILAVNGLRNNKIRKGDELLIPVKRVNYEVIEKDLGELTRYETETSIEKENTFKKTYNIALFLPLMLDKNDNKMSKPLKIDQVQEMYSTTKISFGFYQGFLLAADSLTKAGLNVNIFVYDTQNDTNVIAKAFAKNEFSEVDLVVGPLYKRTIKYASKVCAQRQIPIVLPFNSDIEVLFKNPYVYKGVASNMTLMDGAVDYIVEKNKHHNIILIKPSSSSSDMAIFERVRNRFNEKIKAVGGSYNVKIVETTIGSSSGRDLNAIIKKDTANIVIVPSINLSFVSGTMSRLNKVMNMNPYSKKLSISVFGLEEWNKFDDLDLKYRNRLNQHYASYRYVDYNSQKGTAFIRSFRNNYGTDPNVYCTQGFDVGMYFLSALHLYGTNFNAAIDSHYIPLVQNDFNFKSIDASSGRENQHVCIVKYDNYNLVQVK